MNIQELIAEARAKVGQKTEFPVELAGVLIDITLIKVDGATWSGLTAINPPREGSEFDRNIGYDLDGMSRAYPIDFIQVDGEPIADDVDPEGLTAAQIDFARRKTWLDILAVLDAPGLKSIAAELWMMNQRKPEILAEELGKARASSKKRPSRSSSGSRRAASQGGSQPKSTSS
jgi:hypothetical protein